MSFNIEEKDCSYNLTCFIPFLIYEFFWGVRKKRGRKGGYLFLKVTRLAALTTLWTWTMAMSSKDLA